jgi:hypothetical protein
MIRGTEMIIEISKDLWLVIEKGKIENSGLFNICDSVGGNTLIDVEEIPALIAALQGLQQHD